MRAYPKFRNPPSCCGLREKPETNDELAPPDGWRHWRDFERALEVAGKGIFPSDAEALDRDAGETIGFVRVLAERGDEEVMNLYDPSIGMQVGIDR